MKIALVTFAVQIGGIETFLKRLALYLKGQGHQVDVIETEERGKWAGLFEKTGITVIDVLPYSFRSRLHHVRRISKLLKQYDVIILNDAPFAQSALGLLPERTVCIPIVHLDMPSFYTNAAGSPGQWDVIVGVGPHVIKTLKERFGISDDQLKMIPYGVEVPETCPTKNKEPGNSCLKVIYAGRMEDCQKGIMRLPDILDRAHKLGLELVLELIGDGPDLERLKLALSVTSPGLQVRFRGVLRNEDVRRSLLDQDVLLLPSNFEGLPIIVMEAMAAGVVPVVSRLPGITDHQVVNGENGFLLEPSDTYGFAAVLAELGRDSERLNKMSMAAWRQARQCFTIEDMTRSYMDLIIGLTSSRTDSRLPERSGKIYAGVLGDLPYLPLCLVRPCRKFLRLIGLWPRS